MSVLRTTEDRISRDKSAGLDSTDAGLIRGLSVDGRRSASDLARDLGISRAYANRRLQALLKRDGIRIQAFSSPGSLGYRAGALTGIRVSPDGMAPALAALRSFPSVCQLMITSGLYDMVMFSIFPTAADLSTFLTEDLAKVPGVQSTETLIIADWRVRDALSEPGTGFYSYFSSQPAYRKDAIDGPRSSVSRPIARVSDSGSNLDLLDLRILREIERDPRQQLSVLAKKVGISRRSASIRLRNLMARNVARVVVYTDPLEVGFNFFPVIGMRVSPTEIEAVSEKLESLAGVFWTVRVSGRYDLVAGAMFAGPADFARFVWQELAVIPGVLSLETTIGLVIRKWSLPYMATSLLDSLALGKSGS